MPAARYFSQTPMRTSLRTLMMPFRGTSIQNRISRWTQLSPKPISRQTGGGSPSTRGVSAAASTASAIASRTSQSKDTAIGVRSRSRLWE